MNGKWKNLKEKTGRDNAIKQITYRRRDQTRTEDKVVQGDRNRNRVIITSSAADFQHSQGNIEGVLHIDICYFASGDPCFSLQVKYMCSREASV